MPRRQACRASEGSPPPLTPARMHLEMGLGLELADLDQRASVLDRQALFGATVPPQLPGRPDKICKLGTLCPTPQGFSEVHSCRGVEAEKPLSVGSEPAP